MNNKKIIRIGLSGASGRMGKEIFSLADSNDDIVISSRFDRKHSLNQWDPFSIDVVVDFSSSQALTSVVHWCVKNKKPLVSGTTGLKDHKILENAQKQIALLWSPNMSLGIACIKAWLKNLSPSIKKWDIQIQEIHHRLKKDTPSGTALMLQKTLEKQGFLLQKTLSTRGGNCYGNHKILFMGENESISLEHIAQDRKIFAQGAIHATRWIINQKPGYYEIKHCL